MYNFSVNLYTNCEPVTWRPCNCQSEHVLNIKVQDCNWFARSKSESRDLAYTIQMFWVLEKCKLAIILYCACYAKMFNKSPFHNAYFTRPTFHNVYFIIWPGRKNSSRSCIISLHEADRMMRIQGKCLETPVQADIASTNIYSHKLRQSPRNNKQGSACNRMLSTGS
jgi:hypothetical protein